MVIVLCCFSLAGCGGKKDGSYAGYSKYIAENPPAGDDKASVRVADTDSPIFNLTVRNNSEEPLTFRYSDLSLWKLDGTEEKNEWTESPVPYKFLPGAMGDSPITLPAGTDYSVQLDKKETEKGTY
ncbi:MAG: hypothetical protein IJL98_02630 [Lachnospiraceae bacterium]|nr:hypothetical protein [Lachnospiraceae bacterium]